MSDENDHVLAWVKKLNDLGRRMDEQAASLHPSAWPEALRADIERWKRLAREGPNVAGEAT